MRKTISLTRNKKNKPTKTSYTSMSDLLAMATMAKENLDIKSTTTIKEVKDNKRGAFITMQIDSETAQQLMLGIATGEATHVPVLYVVNYAQYEEVTNRKPTPLVIHGGRGIPFENKPGGAIEFYQTNEPVEHPYDYRSIALPGGGHATVSGEGTPEVVDALNKMVELVKDGKLPHRLDPNATPTSNLPVREVYFSEATVRELLQTAMQEAMSAGFSGSKSIDGESIEDYIDRMIKENR
jgi:hypothetical protein